MPQTLEDEIKNKFKISEFASLAAVLLEKELLTRQSKLA